MMGECRRVAKRVLLFGIFHAMIFVCAVPCHAEPHSLSAIWFAHSLHQPMSAYPAKADELDKRHYVRF